MQEGDKTYTPWNYRGGKWEWRVQVDSKSYAFIANEYRCIYCHDPLPLNTRELSRGCQKDECKALFIIEGRRDND